MAPAMGQRQSGGRGLVSAGGRMIVGSMTSQYMGAAAHGTVRHWWWGVGEKVCPPTVGRGGGPVRRIAPPHVLTYSRCKNAPTKGARGLAGSDGYTDE